jgi:hypothetical protein
MTIDGTKKIGRKVVKAQQKSTTKKEMGGAVARKAFGIYANSIGSFFFNTKSEPSTKSSKQSPKKSTTHSSYLFQGGYDGPDYQLPMHSLKKSPKRSPKLRYDGPNYQSPKKSPKKKTPNPYPSFDLYGDD